MRVISRRRSAAAARSPNGAPDSSTASRTNVFTFLGSPSIYGDGYVEAIGNSTLQQIAAAQPTAMRGQIINVPMFEAPGQTRIGRSR